MEAENMRHGGAITPVYWVVILTSPEVAKHLSPPQEDREVNTTLEQRLLPSTTTEDNIYLDSVEIRCPRDTSVPKHSKPRAWGEIRDKGSEIHSPWATVYETDHPGPAWNLLTAGDTEFFGPQSFGVVEGSHMKDEKVRRVSLQETLNIIGLPTNDDSVLLHDEDLIRSVLHKTVTVEVLTASIHMIKRALSIRAEEIGSLPGPLPILTLALHKTRSAPDARYSVLSTYQVNRWTTIPIPSEKAWRDATEQDEDLQQLKRALDDPTALRIGNLKERGYHKPFIAGNLAWEDGSWFHYEEPKRARVRQLRTRVVPQRLRQVIFSACHVSPMSGHTGMHKTFWRIAVRFWWPKMLRDIRALVKACAHCILANSVSNESAAYLHSYITDVPFEIMFLDVWTPGDIPSRLGHLKVLTMLEGMCGFAAAAPLAKEDSTNIAQATFTSFIVPFGLPRLIVVDAGNPMHGLVIVMCKTLGIPHMTVARGNHRAIRNERFHRYLNKALKITVADLQSTTAWWQTVLFSVYAWNASPIDGTDLIRSAVAIGREFLFPIDLEFGHNPTIREEGQSAVEYAESALPLLRIQRLLLKVLNDERQERHRELKNRALTTKTFQEGDVVVVRRQVQSKADQQVSAKGQFRTKGPYRVLKQATPGSYWVQKVPFGRRCRQQVGKPRKARTVHMEQLPSTLCIHKRADGVDKQ